MRNSSKAFNRLTLAAIALSVLAVVFWSFEAVKWQSAVPSVSNTPDWRLQTDLLTHLERDTHEVVITDGQVAEYRRPKA